MKRSAFELVAPGKSRVPTPGTLWVRVPGAALPWVTDGHPSCKMAFGPLCPKELVRAIANDQAQQKFL
jgi:hypothetical protein